MALQTMASEKLKSNVNIWDEAKKKEKVCQIELVEIKQTKSLKDKSIANIKIVILFFW